MATIRVLLCDPHPIARLGVRTLLEQDGLEVAEVDGSGLLRAVERLGPDIVVLEVDLPTRKGVAAIRDLTRPGGRTGPEVLVLTAIEDDQIVFAALRAGARGFLLKGCPPEEILRGIRSVASGDAAIGARLVGRLLTRMVPYLPVPEDEQRVLRVLTPREREVLRLVALGRSNSAIARGLRISDATVRSHVHHVLLKLSLTDRTQAVAFAYRSGFASPFDGRP